MLITQKTLPLKKRIFCGTRNFDDEGKCFLPFCHLIMTLSMEFTTWYAIKPDITRFKPDLNLQLRNSHRMKNSKRCQANKFSFCKRGQGTSLGGWNKKIDLRKIDFLILFEISVLLRLFKLAPSFNCTLGRTWAFISIFSPNLALNRPFKVIHIKWLHSTWWKYSTLWKCSLHFVYIIRTDWNILIELCKPDPSFNRNILRSLYLKFKTSAHAHIATSYFFLLFTNFLT